MIYAIISLYLLGAVSSGHMFVSLYTEKEFVDDFGRGGYSTFRFVSLAAWPLCIFIGCVVCFYRYHFRKDAERKP